MSEPRLPTELSEEEAERLAIEKARAEIAAGEGVPHQKVREWLLKLRNGEIALPPWK